MLLDSSPLLRLSCTPASYARPLFPDPSTRSIHTLALRAFDPAQKIESIIPRKMPINDPYPQNNDLLGPSPDNTTFSTPSPAINEAQKRSQSPEPWPTFKYRREPVRCAAPRNGKGEHIGRGVYQSSKSYISTIDLLTSVPRKRRAGMDPARRRCSNAPFGIKRCSAGIPTAASSGRSDDASA